MITIGELPKAISRFGVLGTAKLVASRRRLKQFLPAWTNTISVRGYPFPFHFRHGTTDKYVIAEVLLREQYAQVLGLSPVRSIVDAGANIGTASVFLLNAFPEATLVALEPDPGNFDMLSRNLSYYKGRAAVLRTALWHQQEALTLDRGHYRDGGEWSIQVQSAMAGAEPVEATTMGALMSDFQLESIDLLKIDIEGAERHLFEDDRAAAWLRRVKTIAIELHDPESRQAFARAVAPLGGQSVQYGEVTFWRSPR